MNQFGALPLPDLVGRVALVTGADGGIGRAVAVDLAAAGATVAVIARNREGLADTLFEIESNDGRAAAFVSDLSHLDAAGVLVRDVERQLGPIGILINNAETAARLGPTDSLEPSDAEQSLRLNVVTAVVLSAMAIPGMRQLGWGRVVNVSNGVVAHPNAMIGATYTYTQAALESHTLDLAAQLGGSGVTANVYRPGRVDMAARTWIRGHDADRVGGGLVERLRSLKESGELITAGPSARSLVVRVNSDETGQVWDVADDLTAVLLDGRSATPGTPKDDHDPRPRRTGELSKWFPESLPEWLSR